MSNAGLVPETSAERTKDMQDTLDELYGALEKPHSGKPIQCVNLAGAPLDMCAVAHATFRRYMDRYPVLLLPCSRHVPEHHYRGVDYLVQNLANFFEGRPLTEHPARLSPAQISDLLQSIRLSLTKYSAIIVFVGYSPVRSDYSYLNRAIRDEPLMELLSQLAHVSLGEVGEPADLEIFERSRLVVLSDGKMDVLPPFSTDEINYRQQSSRSGAYDDLLANISVREEQRKRIIADLELAPSRVSEAIAMSYAQLVCIKDLTDISKKKELSRQFIHSQNSIITNLVKAIRNECNPFELLMLRFIAMAGGGMRRDTLLRCMQMWYAATPPCASMDVAPHLRRDLNTTDLSNALITKLKIRFSCILVEGYDEPQPDLEYELHPYEFSEQPVSTSIKEADEKFFQRIRQGEPPTSLDFRYADVRNAILNDVDDNSEDWSRYLLHEIVCKEALQQQILIRRNVNLDQDSSVRAHQRTLEALYHGLLSLPPPELWNQAKDWPKFAGVTMLPIEPVARFRYLYLVLFHDLLEGTSARRMSLNWATDKVKLDILLLFHSAFSRKPLTLADRPIWDYHEKIPKMEAILEDYQAAVAVVLRNTDDLQLWKEFQRGLGRTTFENSKGVSPSHLIERAGFDLQVTKLGPMAVEVESFLAAKIKTFRIDIEDFLTGPWKDAGTGAELIVPTEFAFDDFLKSIEKICMEQPLPARASLVTWLGRLAHVRYQAIEFSDLRRWNHSMEALAILLVVRRVVSEGKSTTSPLLIPEIASRSLRVLARAGLEALRLLTTPDRKGNKWNDPQRPEVETMRRRLAWEVRRALDLYALHYSSNAPEAVSMLILEARFARTVGAFPPTDTKRHYIAINSLKNAESRMTDFHSRPRLRIRLLIERCATLRGLALEKFETGDLRPERYLRLAWFDLHQLRALVLHMYPKAQVGNAWHELVERQAMLTKNAEKKLLGVSPLKA